MVCVTSNEHQTRDVQMHQVQEIRNAFDAYQACDDGVSGYELMVAVRDACLAAITEIAKRHNCDVSDEAAGSGSYYINVVRYDADECLEVDVKVRVSNHDAKYANDWSFTPDDSEQSIARGLARIEELCK